MKKIILGSSSPRRKEILKTIIPEFEIVKPEIDESIKSGEKPVNYAERISSEKAVSIRKSITTRDTVTIISSDTIVTIENTILGKPENYDHAREMLSLLQGKSHHVITALTLLICGEDGQSLKELTRHEKTSVKFRELENIEIERYLSLINYMDKAGAYAIQEHGDLIIRNVEGSVTNVIGFPLRLFFSMMQEAGHRDLLE